MSEETGMALPELGVEERAAALEKAGSARRERAEIKRRMKSGEVGMRELLSMDGEAVMRMRVMDAVRSMPGYGEARARALLKRLRISESRRIRGLGARQREALAEEFGGDLS